MYDVEATVTETSPTVLKLTADWPVDWLRETSTRTMEIQREFLPGEILESVRRLTAIEATGGNCKSALAWSSDAFSRANESKTEIAEEHPVHRRLANRCGCRWKHSLSSGPAGSHQGGASRPVGVGLLLSRLMAVEQFGTSQLFSPLAQQDTVTG
jgi:hypothetical protein